MTTVDRIFERLAGLYGSRFADAWRGTDLASVKRVWSQEMSSYSHEEIAAGLAACSRRDWPPTLPEFLKLCRPPIDAERAFHEAVEQIHRRADGRDTWSSPIIFWAAAKLGNDLKTMPYAAIKSRWAAAMEEVEEKLRTGQLKAEIPKRRDALPAPGQSTMPREEACRILADIRRGLVGRGNQ